MVSDKQTFKQILVGFPSTGKTTFLAALWYITDGPKITGAMRLSTYSADRQYIVDMEKDWIEFKEILHTKLGIRKNVKMNLVDASTQKEVEVLFPDISGETFDHHFLERKSDIETYNSFVQANGCLLFIHSTNIKKAGRIDEALAAKKKLGIAINNAPNTSIPDWEAKESPTQVKLVEIMQFIKFCRVGNQPLALSVIISAWDLVKDGSSPEEWLEKETPLLHQYLCSNKEIFNFKIFGVSAQGGDLKSLAEREELLNKNPWERIRVVFDGRETNDISEPIKWMIK